ncbi:MAG: hypothetical protein WEE89_13235 [Gemmatimonadota bacterium]
MRLKTFFTISAALLTGIPVSGQQIAWDAPSFFSPRPMDDIGLYVSQTQYPGGGSSTGLSGIWRQSGNLNLGVRAGVGDLEDAGGTVLVGAELYGPLNRLLPSTSVDLSWMLGGGAVFGDNYTLFSMPLGISIGMRLGTGAVQFAPYVHPRWSLDIAAFDVNGTEQTRTGGSIVIDAGADVSLGQRFILRLGGSFLDREAFGAGVALRWPRPISVVR